MAWFWNTRAMPSRGACKKSRPAPGGGQVGDFSFFAGLAAGFSAGLAGMVVKAWVARYDAFVVYALPVAVAWVWVLGLGVGVVGCLRTAQWTRASLYLWSSL